MENENAEKNALLAQKNLQTQLELYKKIANARRSIISEVRHKVLNSFENIRNNQKPAENNSHVITLDDEKWQNVCGTLGHIANNRIADVSDSAGELFCNIALWEDILEMLS